MTTKHILTSNEITTLINAQSGTVVEPKVIDKQEGYSQIKRALKAIRNHKFAYTF